ncbi:xanthine dehydrogenase family protein molybdopterin-binding subunit [Saccharopolyspora sp. ASAGF58]|uniref:xanthine dehydrogenase family protein molybdopterin-binding subunit n=1 Tax=Saccharopolyspora sp. ASAGF58 TaxID=2719023 RepID=UPI00143FC1DD|nr:xanthine dehydrogenase family protein molybdopterin-binding subunit [Saccharopolyspora sp. ASAGF58]QIZ37134.1 xanthine dehydrogenase family protein [Saccharopolyspora sp. ASAGF58]
MTGTTAGKGTGKPMERVEDERLLRGLGTYVDDLTMPGTLHAYFVRSVHANARITSIDVEQARRLSGVHAVWTGHDLGELNGPLPLLGPHPDLIAPRTQLPLAVDRVRYVGEAIVMVIAESRYRAEDAAELVEIHYEPLPAVVEFTDADRGMVHDDIADNVAAVVHQSRGDVDTALASAPHKLTVDLEIERSGGMPMEGRGVHAKWDRRTRRLHVSDSTQSHVAIRQGLSRILDLPLDQLEVVAPDVGGGFGTKIMLFYPEEVLVPLAAMRLEATVAWTEDRYEHFISANQERGQVHRATVGYDDDGKLLAVRTAFVHDTGAYIPYGIAVPAVTGTHLPGQYHVPNYEFTGQVVYTNKPPVSPYRGAGRPQGVFVMERLISAMAKSLGLEPSEVRRRNFIPDDAFPYDTGLDLHDGSRAIYDSGRYAEGFQLAMSHADLTAFRARQKQHRSEGRFTGIGSATYVEGTGVGPYEGCTAALNPNGRIVVDVSVPSQGQGHATTFAQLASDVLSCDPASVVVRATSGGAGAVGHGTFGSRAAVMAGNAVAAAATNLRRQILATAAEFFECSAEDLSIDDGFVQVTGTGARISLADLATGVNPIRYPAVPATSTPWTGGSAPPIALAATEYFCNRQWVFGFGAHVAEVEVDIATGKTTLLNYVVVHDCGRVLNPLVVDGQILGGLVQGIGGALLELLAFDAAGQPTTTSFLNFRLPTIDDLPPLVLDEMQTPSPWNPLGIKGTGEAGIIPVAAAIAEAIEDALEPLGVSVTRMPMTPERMRHLIATTTTQQKES